VILGDLNQDPVPDEVSVLLHLGGRTDAGAAAGPTCFSAGSRVASRVDLVLLNPPAGRLLEGLRVDHGTALPTHAVLRFELPARQVGLWRTHDSFRSRPVDLPEITNRDHRVHLVLSPFIADAKFGA